MRKEMQLVKSIN